MNIIFLTIGTITSLEESGVYTDLLRYSANVGHNVDIICQKERRETGETSLTKTSGINLLKVKTGNITKTGFIEKGISTLKIGYEFRLAIEKYFKNKKYDLILYTTPPITFVDVLKYLKKKNPRAISYLMLKDIFPQNAVDLGIMKKTGFPGLIYKYFRNVEKNLYKYSDIIGCMSDANIEYVTKHNYLGTKSVELLPNTIDALDLDIPDRNLIRKKYNIPEDKKILIYGGNFGKPQNVAYILRIVEQCKELENYHFVFVGKGTDFNKVSNYVSTNPGNLTVLDSLPKTDYINILGSSDIGLLFLDYRFTIPNFPSRLLDYMNAGLPVISSTDTVSDVGDLIESNNMGWKLYSNDETKFYELLRMIENTKVDLNILGENSKKTLERSFRTEIAYNTIMNSYKKAVRDVQG